MFRILVDKIDSFFVVFSKKVPLTNSVTFFLLNKFKFSKTNLKITSRAARRGKKLDVIKENFSPWFSKRLDGHPEEERLARCVHAMGKPKSQRGPSNFPVMNPFEKKFSGKNFVRKGRTG